MTLPVGGIDFWTFSWHEIGVFDVPAVINYSLTTTGQDSLYWVGHSMGTTQFFVAMSEHPELNSKIKLMSAFAPVSYTEHMISPIALLAPLADLLDDIFQFLGVGELLPSSPLMDFLGATICRETSPLQGVCTNLLFLVMGFDSVQMNKTLLPIIMGHSPAGSSTRCIIHYAQGINSGKFRKFNHGKEKNMELYGQPTPPDYDISKITCPVAFYWGQNDWLGSPPDVYRLAEQLPNLVRKFRINHNKYNHLDFLFAIDNNSFLNHPFMEFLKYF
jgi:pimeloyl-ACP methyl ester carboxylesterase